MFFCLFFKQKKNVMRRHMHVETVDALMRRYCAIAMMTVEMVRMNSTASLMNV